MHTTKLLNNLIPKRALIKVQLLHHQRIILSDMQSIIIARVKLGPRLILRGGTTSRSHGRPRRLDLLTNVLLRSTQTAVSNPKWHVIRVTKDVGDFSRVSGAKDVAAVAGRERRIVVEQPRAGGGEIPAVGVGGGASVGGGTQDLIGWALEGAHGGDVGDGRGDGDADLAALVES